MPTAEAVIEQSRQPIISVDEANTRLRLGDDPGVAAALESLVHEVSSVAEDIIGRPILYQRYRYDRWAAPTAQRINLCHWPVNPGTVTFETIDLRGHEDYEWWEPSFTYRVEPDSLWAVSPSYWPSEMRVEYEAGWVPRHRVVDATDTATVSPGQWIRPTVLPGLVKVIETHDLDSTEPDWTEDSDDWVYFSAAEEMPWSIMSACYEIVIALWSRRQYPRDVVELAVGEARMRFEERSGRGETQGISNRVIDTLRRYRAVVI